MSDQSLNDLAKKILYAGMSGNVPTTLIYEMAVEGLKIEIAEKDARIAELEDRITRLETALTPFALAAKNDGDMLYAADLDYVYVHTAMMPPDFYSAITTNNDDHQLMVYQFRVAANVLKGKENKQ